MKKSLAKKYYIGVMSGTSLDGVDVVVCEINRVTCKLIHAKEYPFEKPLKDEILQTINKPQNLQNFGELDHKLGVLYAKHIHQFLNDFHLKTEDILAIGLHGQTLWHAPDTQFPFSMQLGDPNIVVAQTGICTVADFRRMDVANGGQGAPFAPAFHQFLFHDLSKNVAVVNIGGMANITLLEKNLKGWDSGCGNVLLDSWIMQTQEKPYDEDGTFAKSGILNEALLSALLQDKYFAKEAPKSTGREYFNAAWLKKHLASFPTLPDADVQRTLLELTATSIANDLNKTQTQKCIICGGGAKNGFLMQRLQALSQAKIIISDKIGVSGDFLEAMAFAWFAYKRIQKETIDLCSVTGAKKASLLGGIYG